MAWSLWAVTLLGCGGAGRAADQFSLVDDAGDTLHVAQAHRIVSLSPPFTELLFAIGAGGRVVGRTRWDEYPPEVRNVPSVGEGLEPNVEAVTARRPDLVLLYHSSSNSAAIAQLRRVGIETLSLDLNTLADFRRAARLLGRLTGHGPEADSSLESLDAGLEALRSTGPAPAVRPTVLLLAWDNPPIVIGAGSFLSELVQWAGARNVFDDVPQPSATVSLETIAARDPGVVLLTGGALPPPFAARPEWQVVPAVRARRFVKVDGSEFAWPSFRAAQAVRELRAALAVDAP